MEHLGENLERTGQGKSVSKGLIKKVKWDQKHPLFSFLEGIFETGERFQPGNNSGLSNLHGHNQSETKR